MTFKKFKNWVIMHGLKNYQSKHKFNAVKLSSEMFAISNVYFC